MDWDRVFEWTERVKADADGRFRYVCPKGDFVSPPMRYHIEALHQGEQHEVTAHGGRVS